MNQKIKRYLYHYRKEIGIGVVCFSICFLFLILLLPKSKASSGKPEEPLIIEPIIETTESIQEESVIRVDIKGAVVSPGVYEMRQGSRVNDVIYQAGGVLENADLSRINLSKHVVDEMVIIVYTKEEIAALQTNQTKIEYVYIEPDCTCPDNVNDACIMQKPTDANSSVSDKISLNVATQEELETLPGIGESKAKIIIEYREKKPFETIDELKEIKGIGEKIFEKIKDNITI